MASSGHFIPSLHTHTYIRTKHPKIKEKIKLELKWKDLSALDVAWYLGLWRSCVYRTQFIPRSSRFSLNFERLLHMWRPASYAVRLRRHMDAGSLFARLPHHEPAQVRPLTTSGIWLKAEIDSTNAKSRSNPKQRPGGPSSSKQKAPVRSVPPAKNWARSNPNAGQGHATAKSGATARATTGSGSSQGQNAASSKQQARSTSPPSRSSSSSSAKSARTQYISLPPITTVFHLARVLNVNMRKLQFRMEQIGFDDTRPDRLLKLEDAELVAAEYNCVVSASEEAVFDIYPRPEPSAEERAKLPLRPPVVTIMGHVDHGKTTLLDTLRSTSVAQGEAGGITQHIGAFSVPVNRPEGAISSVTFLDTPGHAAFSTMRSRGTSVTDIVVLVVAADDSVMPQTREVISLVRDGERKVPLVVAITKIDAPKADPHKVRYDLFAEGVEVEELGGDVPCVEVSAKQKQGLDTLDETLAVLAEMGELRAETSGPAEGRILESRVEKGRGNVATVLVQRGVLQSGDIIACGTTWAKVRQLLQPDGRSAKQVLPGYAAQVAGWRELPKAGDEFLGALDEAKCKRAIEHRKRVLEEQALLYDAEQIDQERRRKAEADALRERTEQMTRKELSRIQRAQEDGSLDADAVAKAVREQRLAAELAAKGDAGASAGAGGKAERAELNLILKGDVSGTVEALAGAVSHIGNAAAGVRIVSQSVGDPTESDVNTAHAIGAHIIGFHVKAPKSIQTSASRCQPPVPLHCDDVIYRLMDHVTDKVAALLPPIDEMRVLGEANVAQLFHIKQGQRRAPKCIAGCRVTNGIVSRANEIRILRGDERKEVFRGRLDTLRQVKKDVSEMRKGTECGMSFDGFDDVQIDDKIQCFTMVQVPATLK